MSFRAFVGDQQMSSCLKAILESLAPGNSDVVCLYCAPIRQAATRDIARGNFDNRQRGGRKTRRADADTTHGCSPEAGIDSCPRSAFFPPGVTTVEVKGESKPMNCRHH